ncbi:MAG: helix-turn-helix domain-containing protein, partial [Candidatus Cybelea sp.]
MSERGYGQFCGFARALEIVGDRWALMIVRDLLVGPKRFSDLHTGLPKIPTNVLTTRLKQLEAAGVAVRRALP